MRECKRLECEETEAEIKGDTYEGRGRRLYVGGGYGMMVELYERWTNASAIETEGGKDECTPTRLPPRTAQIEKNLVYLNAREVPPDR
jgi:hypothetical protein